MKYKYALPTRIITNLCRHKNVLANDLLSYLMFLFVLDINLEDYRN